MRDPHPGLTARPLAEGEVMVDTENQFVSQLLSMPILERERDIFPDDLFDRIIPSQEESSWWAMYTMSRREKDLMRRLTALEVPFYSPVIGKRAKSPSGRMRTTFVPLFSNYVFVYGTVEDRLQALTTNCIAKTVQVDDGQQLTDDLRRFRDLIAMDVPLMPESRLEPGQRVRVRSGKFRGFEGIILRREREVRLLVMVNFIQRGASILLEDFELEAI